LNELLGGICSQCLLEVMQNHILNFGIIRIIYLKTRTLKSDDISGLQVICHFLCKRWAYHFLCKFTIQKLYSLAGAPIIYKLSTKTIRPPLLKNSFFVLNGPHEVNV